MPRENVDTKGRRLLTEGRLLLLFVGETEIRATCRGDSGVLYRLGFDFEHQRWYCSCEAKGRCSHLVALQLVTAVVRRDAPTT